MSQRSRQEAARSSTDVALTRLVWLVALWLGSRLVAGLLTAPFIKEGTQLDPLRLVLTQVPFWAATVGGLYWMSHREGEPFGPFVRWGFKPLDALIGLAAGFGLHWGVNLLYRALDSFGVSGDPSESARNLVEASPGIAGKVTLLVMVSVGAPLVEELYYRGVAQRTAVQLAGGTAAPTMSRRSAWGAAIAVLRPQPHQLRGRPHPGARVTAGRAGARHPDLALRSPRRVDRDPRGVQPVQPDGAVGRLNSVAGPIVHPGVDAELVWRHVTMGK